MKRLLFLFFLFSSFGFSAEYECTSGWVEYGTANSANYIHAGACTKEDLEPSYSSSRKIVPLDVSAEYNPDRCYTQKKYYSCETEPKECVPPMVLDENGTCVDPEPDTDCVPPMVLDENGTCVDPEPDTDCEPPMVLDENGTCVDPEDPDGDGDGDGDGEGGGGGGSCPDPASTKDGFPYVGTSSSLSACNTSIADFGGGNGAIDVLESDGKECIYCYYTKQEDAEDCKSGFHYKNPPEDLTCVKDDCGANQINTSDGCMCAEGYDPLIFSDPLECVEEETEDPEEDGCEKAKDSLHGYPFQNSYKTAVLCRDAIDTLGGGLGAESTDKTVENCPTHCYYEKEEDEEDEDPEEDGEDDNETDTPGEEGEDGEDDNETDTPGEEGEDDNETDTPGEEGEEVNFEFEFDEESADAYKQEAGSIIEGILSDSFSELTTLYSINIPAPAGCGCEDIQETILGFPLKIEYCSPLKELFEIARPILWLVFLVSLLFNFLRSNP